MDPHKRSVTIEVMAADETVLGGGRYATDVEGFAALRRYVSRFPDRVWAIEGCSGIGHHIAMRLLAIDEEVIDIPRKLSARARVFATGQGRKTDATDAHSVALVGTRMSGLRPVVNDEELAVLRLQLAYLTVRPLRLHSGKFRRQRAQASIGARRREGSRIRTWDPDGAARLLDACP